MRHTVCNSGVHLWDKENALLVM